MSLSLHKRHPIDPSRPLIDYNLSLMLLPALLLGVSVGESVKHSTSSIQRNLCGCSSCVLCWPHASTSLELLQVMSGHISWDSYFKQCLQRFKQTALNVRCIKHSCALAVCRCQGARDRDAMAHQFETILE